VGNEDHSRVKKQILHWTDFTVCQWFLSVDNCNIALKSSAMLRLGISMVLLGALMLVFGCAPNPETPATDEQPEPETMTGKELLDKLKAEALDPNDLAGRLNKSIVPLQEEYDKSEPLMAEFADVKVSVDGGCTLTIENRADGIQQTKVDLSKLDVNGLSLIPDLQAGEFPGIRIKVLNDEPLVEIYQEGKLVTRNNELVIMMASRPSIERIAPVIVQMIHLCQGTI
jgi:hypothetical protein